MKKLMPAIIAIALGTPLIGVAQTSPTTDEIQALRKEVSALRADYEARLQALESRLQTTGYLNSLAASNSQAAPASATIPAVTGGANAFNPAMSLILSGGYVHTSIDPANYHITGFQLPVNAEAGPGERGFNLAESEFGLAASIDPWLRGAANIALHPDNTVSVEEAYVQTTSLGHGFTVKAGRFFSGIGYLNAQHAHTWDFVDNPLAYQALLGTQYGDDGVQLNLLAPTDQFIELGAEAGKGRSYPGGDNQRNGAGMTALMLHTGGDIGDSNSWRAGISTLNAKAADQQLVAFDATDNPISNTFTGSTRVWVVDGVWKWAPHGNAIHTNFKLQGEYLRSTRRGVLNYDVEGINLADDYHATQSGWYVQGIYQFIPHWRVGLRTERLNAGTPAYGVNAAALAINGEQPRKHTAMFDFSPSEFSRMRLQFARDYSRGTVADNQVLLQYQMSLGAHGAHNY
ncbi:MAG: porin [Steroidobacteraceae bacterium]